jgi:hypothetical protein
LRFFRKTDKPAPTATTAIIVAATHVIGKVCGSGWGCGDWVGFSEGEGVGFGKGEDVGGSEGLAEGRGEGLGRVNSGSCTVTVEMSIGLISG